MILPLKVLPVYSYPVPTVYHDKLAEKRTQEMMSRMDDKRFRLLVGLLIHGFWLLGSNPAHALQPHQILVLANRNAAKSVGLARYYMQKRRIPEENLLQLWITDKEQCSREDYERNAVGPVRKYIEEKDPMRLIRCIVTMYGLPLKVAPPQISWEEDKELIALEKEKDALAKRMEDQKKLGGDRLESDEKKLEDLDRRMVSLEKKEQGASFDSEIALVHEKSYPLYRWVPNPYFLGFGEEKGKGMPQDVLMVSRLDGPSEEIVRRVIDDSFATEKTGLRGTAYFDARWPRPRDEKMQEGKIGYAFYDHSLYKAADLVGKTRLMTVVVNDKPALFGPGECPDAALYAGWYSLARYVDAFQWRPGSVGYHIASSECTTLKRGNSTVWCKMMLEKGVAATVGPVSEPYVQAFPIPELFFRLLISGRWTLAESYALSQPFWSWQMVLIGDPLYSPFKNR